MSDYCCSADFGKHDEDCPNYAPHGKLTVCALCKCSLDGEKSCAFNCACHDKAEIDYDPYVDSEEAQLNGYFEPRGGQQCDRGKRSNPMTERQKGEGR